MLRVSPSVIHTEIISERYWQLAKFKQGVAGSRFTYLVCGGVVHQTDAVDSFQEAEKKASTCSEVSSDGFLPGCGPRGWDRHTSTGGQGQAEKLG